MTDKKAIELIKLLGLKPLAFEGGFYRETYRSRLRFPAAFLPKAYDGKRNAGTAIYYLLTAESFSAFHRLKSDEVYHFYQGDPVELFVLGPKGSVERRSLGSSLTKGTRPQAVVPKGCWQGARLAPGGRFALLGTTVFPGFDFSDFELGDREKLLKLYPRHRSTIIGLTKEPGC
jgi:hypothetical protein